MARDPVIFAMANPDPEITPEEAQEVRDDAIVATGRSDYPNQVNNVLGFPYLFRGALDIHARAINDEMKIACAEALAGLAREDVPDEVAMAYGRKLTFGRDYIIPTPFDPRLIHVIPPAVAKAGMATGVARRPILDMEGYVQGLEARMDPTASILHGIGHRARKTHARMIFAEGDDPKVLRAAVAYHRGGFGEAIVVGRESEVAEKLAAEGLADAMGEITVVNAGNTPHLETYKEFLYARLQRKGFDHIDVHRLAARDRHVFAALMLAHDHGDGLVTGATRKSSHVLSLINHVFDADAAVRRRRGDGGAAQGPDRADRRHAGAGMARGRGSGRHRRRRGAGGPHPRAGAAGGLRLVLDLRLSGQRAGDQDARGAQGAGRPRGRFRI